MAIRTVNLSGEPSSRKEGSALLVDCDTTTNALHEDQMLSGGKQSKPLIHFESKII